MAALVNYYSATIIYKILILLSNHGKIYILLEIIILEICFSQ